MLLIQIGPFKVNIVNIYAPTNLTEGKDFFDNLHEFFLPADHRIIDGDFNCYECDLDKFGGNFSPAKFLCDFRSVFNFTDICGIYIPGLMMSHGLTRILPLVVALINFLFLKIFVFCCFLFYFSLLFFRR